MALTTEQLEILKTDITVTRADVVYVGYSLLELWNLGEHYTLSRFYNQVADPSYTVWSTSVMIAATMQGAGFDWTRVDNLTVGRARIMEFMIASSPMNFALSTTRDGVESCFSVEAADAPCRLAIYRGAVQLATYGEQLYATGSGMPPNHHGIGPSVRSFEGAITGDDVTQAHYL